MPLAASVVPAPDLASPDLGQLLQRIAARDAQALGTFYDLTLGRTYAIILRVLRQSADAEEVVSDVYWQVWEKAGDFDPGRGAPLAWLQTLAWSRAVDRLRRGRRQPVTVSLHPEPGDPSYRECEGLRVEDVAISGASASAVQAAFRRLSDPQQQVLRLAFEEDMSHQDIAAATGWPLGTVKSHARRGLASLREALTAGEGA